jgi:membrane-associated PAP2 superfamily phosphatase
MHRHWRALVRVLRKLKLTDLVAVANLAKSVVDIVRALTGHN